MLHFIEEINNIHIIYRDILTDKNNKHTCKIKCASSFIVETYCTRDNSRSFFELSAMTAELYFLLVNK